jgi:hypothetical protein
LEKKAYENNEQRGNHPEPSGALAAIATAKNRASASRTFHHTNVSGLQTPRVAGKTTGKEKKAEAHATASDKESEAIER